MPSNPKCFRNNTLQIVLLTQSAVFINYYAMNLFISILFSFFFFLVLLARSNFDHYARECDFGILKKKKQKQKKEKSFGCVLTK